MTKARFQAKVYRALISELGLPWPEVERRIYEAIKGRDVLVGAAIKNEIANLVEMCVRIDKDAVIVTGFEEPLVYGDLFLHPLSRELCVVGESGAPPSEENPDAKLSPVVRKLSASVFLCKRLGVWFKIDYRFKLRYEHFNQPGDYFGHVDFLKDDKGLTYNSQALTDEEIREYKLAG